MGQFFRGFILLMQNLPALITFFQSVYKANVERETETHIREDLEKINAAFKAKDPEALRALFNS